MAKLFLRGRVFWCWGYDVDGKRWQESTHQREREAARLAAREIERRYAADPTHRARSKLTVERALGLVLEYQRESGKAPATIRASTYHAEHLVGLLNAKQPLASLTLADTTGYVRKRLDEGASRHTIAKELIMLTQAMRRAAKLGLYKPTLDPRHFVPDELGKVYTPRERWLTRDEYNALLAALRDTEHRTSERRSDYVVVWCNMGLRKSELFGLRSGCFDPFRNQLRVEGTKTEDARRMVPANAEATEVLNRRNSYYQPFPEWFTVTRDLAAACRRAGIAPVSCNDLRRTFCSWLCQAGVPERVCADLMGHASTVMVRSVYGHLDQVSLAAAVDKIGAVAAAVAPLEENKPATPESSGPRSADFSVN